MLILLMARFLVVVVFDPAVIIAAIVDLQVAVVALFVGLYHPVATKPGHAFITAISRHVVSIVAFLWTVIVAVAPGVRATRRRVSTPGAFTMLTSNTPFALLIAVFTGTDEAVAAPMKPTVRCAATWIVGAVTLFSAITVDDPVPAVAPARIPADTRITNSCATFDGNGALISAVANAHAGRRIDYRLHIAAKPQR